MCHRDIGELGDASGALFTPHVHFSVWGHRVARARFMVDEAREQKTKTESHGHRDKIKHK